MIIHTINRDEGNRVLSQSWNSNRIVFHHRENIYTFFTDHCSLEDVLTNLLLGLFSLLLGEFKYSNIPPGKKTKLSSRFLKPQERRQQQLQQQRQQKKQQPTNKQPTTLTVWGFPTNNPSRWNPAALGMISRTRRSWPQLKWSKNCGRRIGRRTKTTYFPLWIIYTGCLKTGSL